MTTRASEVVNCRVAPGSGCDAAFRVDTDTSFATIWHRPPWCCGPLLESRLGCRAYTLHPDEWALNQVVRRLGPDLNPHFFFYGSFPIYLYRATAEALSWLTGLDWLDTSRVALIGRFYAALWRHFNAAPCVPGWAATVGRHRGTGGGAH